MTPVWLVIVSCSLGLNVLLFIALGVTLFIVWRQFQAMRWIEQELNRICLTSRTPSPR